jgi:hypothetical protein
LSNFELEIERLKREIARLESRRDEVPTYSFSKVKIADLKKLFSIEQEIDTSDKFCSWFNSAIDLSESVESFLKELIYKNRALVQNYNEEDLKLYFLSPLFNSIDFKSFEKKYRAFYNEKIRYETEKFIFNGEVDFVIASGLFQSGVPYFFIQEFKKSKEFSNPEPQLLAEMVAGVELSGVKEMKGAFIIGAIWNFVILEKLDESSYRYYVSENFDSTKLEDLKAIYRNLIFVKDEITEKIE